MTVLGECFLFTAVLSIAACLSTKAYDPRTVTILPSSPCDSAFCYDATVSRVGNISNDARASPRDVPGLYLIPAKDLLLQVVQPERCFTACLSKVGLNSRNNWVRMIQPRSVQQRQRYSLSGRTDDLHCRDEPEHVRGLDVVQLCTVACICVCRARCRCWK